MGRVISKKGIAAREWIRSNRVGTFEQYVSENEESVCAAVFFKLRGKAWPGEQLGRKNAKVERAKTKKVSLTPAAEELLKSAAGKPGSQKPAPSDNESKTVPLSPQIQNTSDAGLIIQAAVKLWIDKGSGMIQLRTLTNSIIKEYKYIQRCLNH